MMMESPFASTAAEAVAAGSPARSSVSEVPAAISLKQAFSMGRRQPATFFADADRHHFIFIFVNGLEN